MAAVALRDNNWWVHHLGVDMPADELVRFCDEHEIDVAILTVVNSSASSWLTPPPLGSGSRALRLWSAGPDAPCTNSPKWCETPCATRAHMVSALRR